MEINKIDSIYASRRNLQILLGVNRRTLDYRIKSLIKKGVFLRLKKGFYLNLEIYNRSQSKKELLEYVGQMMVYPSYLSREYVLAKNGFLAESIYGLTYTTTKKTRQVVTDSGIFIYKNIKKDLFFGFNEKQVDEYKYNVATAPKALFDMLYLNLRTINNQTKENLTKSRFNWDSFSKSEKEEFGQIVIKSKSKKCLKYFNF